MIMVQQEKVVTGNSTSALEAAENIRKIAQNVRDSSIKFRDIVKSMRETGTLKEISEAARDAVVASRDAARDISESAKELRESGVMDETAKAVRETEQIARDTVRDMSEKANKLKQDNESTDRSGSASSAY